MGDTKSGRWEQIRARKLADPAAREQYERTRRAVILTRQILQLVDSERERAGLTKAELAQRAGTNPAAIRRLLTSGSSNPTLRTLLVVFDALGLEFSLKPRKPARRSRGSLPSPNPGRGRVPSGRRGEGPAP